MKKIKIQTNKKTQTIDITSRIQQHVHNTGIEKGTCLIYCPHTTAAITINEGADPNVQKDIINALNKLTPNINYQHQEGNSDAHLKSSLIGTNEKTLIINKKLKLGKWQKIFFCEFDGPRTRKIWIQTQPKNQNQH